MTLPYGRLWHPQPALTNFKSCRTATGCTQHTNIKHLHDETCTLTIHEHLQLHTSQYKQKTQHPSHPLHNILQQPKAKNPLFLTTVATQQTFPQAPWTKSGMIGLPPQTRVKGVSRHNKAGVVPLLGNFSGYLCFQRDRIGRGGFSPPMFSFNVPLDII